jgi:putative Holliday junction resolvase
LPAARARGYDRRVRIAAVDLGRRRVGVAISDATGLIARPLQVIEVSEATRLDRVVDALERLSADPDGLGGVVVGLPRHLDGTPSEETEEALAFAAQLRRRIPQEVALQDERLSSVEAERRLAVRDRDWRSRKKTLDAAAAAVFLQDYLDARR